MIDRDDAADAFDLLGWRVRPRADMPGLNRADRIGMIGVVIASAVNVASLLLALAAAVRG